MSGEFRDLEWSYCGRKLDRKQRAMRAFPGFAMAPESRPITRANTRERNPRPPRAGPNKRHAATSLWFRRVATSLPDLGLTGGLG